MLRSPDGVGETAAASVAVMTMDFPGVSSYGRKPTELEGSPRLGNTERKRRELGEQKNPVGGRAELRRARRRRTALPVGFWS